MRFFNLLFLLFSVLLLSSCQNTRAKKEALQTAKIFFSLIKLGKEKDLYTHYPDFKEFDSYYKSDSININWVTRKKEDWVISVNNRYTNKFGQLTEREITLYIRRNESGKMSILDSKGLCDFEEKDEYIFGINTGCLNSAKDTTDQQIIAGIKRSKELMDDKALDVYGELKTKIKVVNWSWDTGYYTDYASGHGIVKNNSDFSVPDLKYKVTYRNSKGEEITSDDGYVDYDVIEPGESKSFTFYTSYVGNATKASIELKFDEALIYKYLAKKKWTGKECEEFARKHPPKTNKL